MDPISERIEELRLRRGLSVRSLHQLAGIDPTTYRRRLRDGQWRTRALAGIAPVLRVRVEVLTGVDA